MEIFDQVCFYARGATICWCSDADEKMWMSMLVCVCVYELPSNPGFVLIFFHVFRNFSSTCFIFCLMLHISLMQPSFTLLNSILHLELLKQFSKKI